MTHDPAFPDPARITTQADFGREIKALRERAGLTIREVARLTGSRSAPRATTFRTPPADRPPAADPSPRRVRETGQARVARWEAALQRARRRRAGGPAPPYRGLARFEAEDALTRTAEQAYQGLTPDQQRLARQLFLRLVHVADDLPARRATRSARRAAGLERIRRPCARHIRRPGRPSSPSTRAPRRSRTTRCSPPGPGCGPG